MNSVHTKSDNTAAKAFIDRWKKSGGAERANCQSFVVELCALLGVEPPQPATNDDLHNAYTFDRAVTHTRSDGSTTTNFIDCYKRGHFILETKQGIEAKATATRTESRIDIPVCPSPTQTNKSIYLTEFSTPAGKKKTGHGPRDTPRYNEAMRAAYNQADRYARALPVSEGKPPFVLVADIGYSIEVYSEFSRSGKTYVAFPDPQTFRISLTELAQPETRNRLRLIFTDPMALDPSRMAAKVTQEVAHHLAELSKSLEQQGYNTERTAHFLMRCIFTMFAEDVELIPKDGFRNLLAEFTLHTPADKRLPAQAFPDLVKDIWRAMDTGQFSVNLKQKLQRFNGGLFADTEVLPLNEVQITLLYNAASCQWRDVEPAIFGTLLERALNPKERHKLGAHYTPRAYVERLVLPTVIEPLRDDWESVLTAAVVLDREGKWEQAVGQCRGFLRGLTQTLVLDPACGTGNFLYVTLDHMKRLEGEVRDEMAKFTGGHQVEIESSEFQVDPHQFLGIEVNPRAAAIAELVLWIGYLQWQIKALGTTRLPEPVLKAYHNIECRDAVLDYTGTRPRLDKAGQLVTRWDGETKKTHHVTGEEVPDDAARVPVLDYLEPRPAVWPMAHFIVGNPPFLGNKRMREALGDGYTESLRAAYPDVPGSADFVMYWWHKAAEYLRTSPTEASARVVELVPKEVANNDLKRSVAYLRRKHLPPDTDVPVLRQFGFITTNSLRQTFNRRVLQHHMETADNPISLVFAIPDHPWVDAVDGAAVRIAMTVAVLGDAIGTLLTITEEDAASKGYVTFQTIHSRVNADLTSGAKAHLAVQLLANDKLSFQGPIPVGEGFRLTPDELKKYGMNSSSLPSVVKPYIIGRDLAQRLQERYIIDFFGYDLEEATGQFPALIQKLIYDVKPEREQNNDAKFRENWWLWGRSRPDMRLALQGLGQYIGTCRTAKHRLFVFLDDQTVPDAKIIAIALNDAASLGILSSRIHIIWAKASGANLGVGNDSNYNHSECFIKFPFPVVKDPACIRDLAERLDGHRKRQQELYPGLTLTECYNVLEKLRAGTALTPKDRRVHDEGLVTVLLQLHDELDAAVAEAYGWPVDLSDEEILSRLVDLNRERAAEEAQGVVRWLRPEYQNPATKGGAATSQADMLPEDEPAKPAMPRKGAAKPKPAKSEKQPWPASLPERAKAVQSIMREHEGITAQEVAERFKGAKASWMEPIMETLIALGQVE